MRETPQELNETLEKNNKSGKPLLPVDNVVKLIAMFLNKPELITIPFDF